MSGCGLLATPSTPSLWAHASPAHPPYSTKTPMEQLCVPRMRGWTKPLLDTRVHSSILPRGSPCMAERVP